MRKVVYLTSNRFDKPSKEFKKSLTEELIKRGVNVVISNSFDFINRWFKKHKRYDIAIAFDFYKDLNEGCGLTLNKNCSYIGRDFAYNISNNWDLITPEIKWRQFDFVDSDKKSWFKYFNLVSSSVKTNFHLCSINNVAEYEIFLNKFDKIVKIFADEIIRCLRSNDDVDNYRKRVKLAQIKRNKKLKESLQ